MTELILPRRKFLFGALGLIVAPAVIRVAKLMPIMAEAEDEIGCGLDVGFYPGIAAATRKAFISAMYTQIYRTHPLLQAFITERI